MSTITAELPSVDSAGAHSPTGAAGVLSAGPSAGPRHPIPANTPRPAAPATAPARRRQDPLRTAARWSPLLGLAICIGLVWWGFESGVLSSLESLRSYISSLGAWGPVAFLVATVALVVFPVVPGGLTVIAGPVLFGPALGMLYSYVAVCAGLLLNVTIGRYVGLELIERTFAPRTVEKCLGWTRSPHFTRAFAAAITFPIAPDDLLCYVAGATRMRWRTAAVIILLGKPWSLLLYGLGVSTILLQIVPW